MVRTGGVPAYCLGGGWQCVYHTFTEAACAWSLDNNLVQNDTETTQVGPDDPHIFGGITDGPVTICGGGAGVPELTDTATTGGAS